MIFVSECGAEKREDIQLPCEQTAWLETREPLPNQQTFNFEGNA
jgi:hypothetical protein